MEIKFIIPDELIENYRQDELYRLTIEFDFRIIGKLIRRVARALAWSNYRLAWVSKRRKRIKDRDLLFLIKEDFFHVKLILQQAKILDEEVEAHIIAARQTEKHELVQFYSVNIKSITEAVVKKYKTSTTFYNQ